MLYAIIFLVSLLFFLYGLSDLIMRTNYLTISFLCHDSDLVKLCVKVLAQVIIVTILAALTIWSALALIGGL